MVFKWSRDGKLFFEIKHKIYLKCTLSPHKLEDIRDFTVGGRRANTIKHTSDLVVQGGGKTAVDADWNRTWK